MSRDNYTINLACKSWLFRVLCGFTIFCFVCFFLLVSRRIDWRDTLLFQNQVIFHHFSRTYTDPFGNFTFYDFRVKDSWKVFDKRLDKNMSHDFKLHLRLFINIQISLEVDSYWMWIGNFNEQTDTSEIVLRFPDVIRRTLRNFISECILRRVKILLTLLQPLFFTFVLFFGYRK